MVYATEAVKYIVLFVECQYLKTLCIIHNPLWIINLPEAAKKLIKLHETPVFLVLLLHYTLEIAHGTVAYENLDLLWELIC